MAMKLSEEAIRKEIERPSKAKQIQLALEQQERIKFHADTNVRSVNSTSLARFKTFVGSILPKDKFEMVINLLKFPIPTNAVAESVWVKLSKIFDGRNPAINYQFISTQQRDDWEWYRQEILHEPEVWSDKAWAFFKTEINCIVVVDLPEKGDPDKLPEPYFYFVPIEYVKSYSVDHRTGNFEWVIYRNGDRYIVIDGETYRTYSADKDGKIGRKQSTNAHGLGYCPSRFLWSEPLTLSEPDIKKSPLSKVLSDFDWYLFYILAKKHLDIYGSFPIYSGYQEECDYTNQEGDYCRKGFLMTPAGHYKTDTMGNPIPCPLCGKKKNLAGPGTYVEVPVPQEGQPDLRNPVQLLTIDRKALDYAVEEMNRLKTHIVNSCVGLENTIINETSLADKQVDASYDSQEVVLDRTKRGFEAIQQWTDATCCKLRYGDAFLSARINYGSEFYTLTPEALRKRYADAKESGASGSELDALNQQLIETEYRHNPVLLQRMIILSDLEPYRHLTPEEVLTLREKGLVDDATTMLKADFAGYIRQFERENGNIIDFGSQADLTKSQYENYKNKIDTIKQTLYNYAAQKRGGQ